MNLLKKIKNKILKPGEMFRYGTLEKRRIYYSLSRIIRRGVTRERKELDVNNQNKKLMIEEKDGYLKINKHFNSEHIEAVLKEAESDLAEHAKEKTQFQKKEYLQTVKIQKILNLEHPYIQLAMSTELLNVVVPYMGLIPILSDIQLWYSPNDSEIINGSQFFHLDYADVRQVKVFVMVSDITDKNGPLTIIPAEKSENLCKKINYKLSDKDIRIDDAIVESYAENSSHIKATGSKGDLFFVDTSRCLHYGSRGGDKPRDILMIQYVSPFSFRYSWNFQKEAKFSSLITSHMPDQNKLLLGASKYR